MSHYSSCIQRLSLPSEYSTNIYEHVHIALMNVTYRRSNNRKTTKQIVKHNGRLEMIRTLRKQLQESINPWIEKETTCSFLCDLYISAKGFS
jgi:hypothetical protein